MNPFSHASSARYAACRAPGCAACFYDRFMDRPHGSLVMERLRLEARRPRVGHAWHGSNYFRALTRACADLRRAGRGSATRATMEGQ